LKSNFTAEQLQEHIFRDEGGDSSVFLESILQPNSVLVASAMSTHVEMYQKYGPGVNSSSSFSLFLLLLLLFQFNS
jgi:hypothetical protein